MRVRHRNNPNCTGFVVQVRTTRVVGKIATIELDPGCFWYNVHGTKKFFVEPTASFPISELERIPECI